MSRRSIVVEGKIFTGIAVVTAAQGVESGCQQAFLGDPVTNQGRTSAWGGLATLAGIYEGGT